MEVKFQSESHFHMKSLFFFYFYKSTFPFNSLKVVISLREITTFYVNLYIHHSIQTYIGL